MNSILILAVIGIVGVGITSIISISDSTDSTLNNGICCEKWEEYFVNAPDKDACLNIVNDSFYSIFMEKCSKTSLSTHCNWVWSSRDARNTAAYYEEETKQCGMWIPTKCEMKDLRTCKRR